MKKILKFFFGLLLFLFIVISIAWCILKQYITWWVGGTIFFGLLGLWLGIVYLQNFLARRRMRAFVTRVVEQESSTVTARSNMLEALRLKWQESVNLIKLSKCNHLPLYILLGSTESGKTSSIKNAKLNTPLASTVKNAGITPTKNFDFWFLEKSMVLDTAGRYVMPVDEFQDTNEWNEFLHLFIKHRKKEALNGVVVTIEAGRLLNADMMGLRDEGQNIRNRIDSLMQACWAKFPVFIMITKMDQVFGFSEACLNLSIDETNQAAGYLNADNHDWHLVVESFMSESAKKFSELRSRIVAELDEINEAGMLILPQEFLALESGLTEFSKAIFENNPYQEQPLCRGIYFCSALQDSQPESATLKYGNDYIKHDVNQQSRREMFLREFFNSVLPQDQNLVEPAYSSFKRRFFTNGIGLLAICSIFIATASLYTASYLHNREVLNLYTRTFHKMPISSNVETTLEYLQDFQRVIKQLDHENKDWFLPSLGMTYGDNLIRDLKVKYVILYDQNFQNGFLQDLYNKVVNIDKSSPDVDVSLYLEFIAGKIDADDYYLEHGTNEKNLSKDDELNVATLLLPSVVDKVYPDLSPNMSDVINNTYASFLAWNNSKEIKRSHLNFMLLMVRDLFSRDPGDWEFLVHQDLFAPYAVRLVTFWGNSNTSILDSAVVIPGIFTKSGMAILTKFVNLMRESGLKGIAQAPIGDRFWDWYRVAYYKAWYDFAMNFDMGLGSFQSDSDRHRLADSMLTTNNPYNNFLATAATELSPDHILTNPPYWVRLIIELNNAQPVTDNKISIASFKQQILRKVEAVIPSKVSGLDSESSSLIARNKHTSAVLAAYNQSLSQSFPNLISNDSYFRFVSELFSEYDGGAVQKTSVSSALLNFNQLRLLLSSYSSSNPSTNTDIIWKLQGGPLNYLLAYSISRASCAMEGNWSDAVVGKISGVSNSDLPKALLDKNNGLLWKFVNGALLPFLNLNKWGYSAKSIYGQTEFATAIKFNPQFIKFLNTSRLIDVDPVALTQTQYTVNMNTVPITVSDGASVKPYGVILSLQCADGEQVLKNFNYQNKQAFNWSADKCGDTTLSIVFPNLTVTKVYPGKMGFPKFLADFRSGSHQFRSEQFDQADILKNEYQIDWINVKYQIDTIIPIPVTPNASVVKSLSESIPQSITSCGENY